MTHNTCETLTVMLRILKSSFPENSEDSAALRTGHKYILQILLLLLQFNYHQNNSANL